MSYNPNGMASAPQSIPAPDVSQYREQIDELQRSLQKLLKKQSKMRKTQKLNQDQIEEILAIQEKITHALIVIYQEVQKNQQTQVAILKRLESMNEDFLGGILMKILFGGDSPLQFLMPKKPRW